jgi:hypothetical protein
MRFWQKDTAESLAKELMKLQESTPARENLTARWCRRRVERRLGRANVRAVLAAYDSLRTREPARAHTQ